MIVHHDVKARCCRDDVSGELDVGGGRLRIAAWVIVHQDHGGRAEFQSAFDDFARIGGGLIDLSAVLDLIGDQMVLFVQEQNAEMLEF